MRFFFFKQKTAYEMRISDWSSDVCSSDLMLQVRKESGPDAMYFIGGSKHSNEGAYLYRKFCSFWGTNNNDNQARICHSTTVAGVANTWGYGCMTRSEERRVGKEGVRTCRTRWATSH